MLHSETETQDRYGWFDVVGPKVRVLSNQEGASSDYSLLEAKIPPGVFVPLHSHEDRESFFVVSGAAQAYLDGRWQDIAAGGSIDIGAGEMHAWRNLGPEAAHLILVTTYKMRKFFEAIARPVDAGVPSAEDMITLAHAAAKFDYVLATPEENATIGLAM